MSDSTVTMWCVAFLGQAIEANWWLWKISRAVRNQDFPPCPGPDSDAHASECINPGPACKQADECKHRDTDGSCLGGPNCGKDGGGAA